MLEAPRTMVDMDVLATGLHFPEGPVVLEDGSIAVAELRAGQVSRVGLDGSRTVLVKTGGGPNGLAWGPNHTLFICNNGGSRYVEGSIAAAGAAEGYEGGSIQTFDPRTGVLRTLYRECDGHRLSSPNDLVFDRDGGFYFSDIGKKMPRSRNYGAIYYAKADGSHITEIARPVVTPNGVGLSSDEKVLYFAETETGRLWAFDIDEPGQVKKLPYPSPHGARFVAGLQTFTRFDSMAIDQDGNICVGTLGKGCITVIAPDGEIVREVYLPDPYVTNLCFGGEDGKSAYVTLSSTGRLVRIDWPVAGHSLNFAPN